MSVVAVYKMLTGLWLTVWWNLTSLIRLKEATNSELEKKTKDCLEAWLHARNELSAGNIINPYYLLSIKKKKVKKQGKKKGIKAKSLIKTSPII